jgi:hypothetical protein
MPSRVKVFVLIDSRVISRKKTNDCKPRRKEVVLDVRFICLKSIFERIHSVVEVTFKVNAASKHQGGNHAAGRLGRQSDWQLVPRQEFELIAEKHVIEDLCTQ